MNKKIIVFSLLFFSTFLSAAEWEDLVAVFKAPYNKKNIKLIETALKKCPKKRMFELLSTKDDKNFCVTMLYKAARAGDEDLLKLLLRWCPKKRVYDYLILGHSLAGITPLCKASCAKCFDILMCACPASKRYDYLIRRDFCGCTVFCWEGFNAVKHLANFSSKMRWNILKIRDDRKGSCLHSIVGSGWEASEQKLRIFLGVLKICPPDNMLDFLGMEDDDGKTILHYAADLRNAAFIPKILSYLPLKKRYDFLLKQSTNGCFGCGFRPLHLALYYYVSWLSTPSTVSVDAFLKAHREVYVGEKVRYDWAQKGLTFLLSEYKEYKDEEPSLSLLLKRAMCDIVALSLYGFKSFDGSKRKSLLLEHKQQLDTYIGALIDGEQGDVPQSIINYYNALMGNLSSEEEDALSCKGLYDKSFCDTPYGISRSVKCALAKKSFSNMRKTKDITYMSENLKKIMQGKIEKNAIAPDVEFVFG